jgi:hypothetical protein
LRFRSMRRLECVPAGVFAGTLGIRNLRALSCRTGEWLKGPEADGRLQPEWETCRGGLSPIYLGDKLILSSARCRSGDCGESERGARRVARWSRPAR